MMGYIRVGIFFRIKTFFFQTGGKYRDAEYGYYPSIK
jgi:transcriptional regulator of nitric oxide reductase